jgi:hypothetical protein
MKRVVLIALLLYGGSARSAPQMLPTSPTPMVTVTVATRDTLPQLDFETVQKFHPNAFVLSNISNRDVVGMVVRWTYLDAASKERATYYMNQDSFPDSCTADHCRRDALARGSRRFPARNTGNDKSYRTAASKNGRDFAPRNGRRVSGRSDDPDAAFQRWRSRWPK